MCNGFVDHEIHALIPCAGAHPQAHPPHPRTHGRWLGTTLDGLLVASLRPACIYLRPAGIPARASSRNLERSAPPGHGRACAPTCVLLAPYLYLLALLPASSPAPPRANPEGACASTCILLVPYLYPLAPLPVSRPAPLFAQTRGLTPPGHGRACASTCALPASYLYLLAPLPAPSPAPPHANPEGLTPPGARTCLRPYLYPTCSLLVPACAFTAPTCVLYLLGPQLVPTCACLNRPHAPVRPFRLAAPAATSRAPWPDIAGSAHWDSEGWWA